MPDAPIWITPPLLAQNEPPTGGASPAPAGGDGASTAEPGGAQGGPAQGQGGGGFSSVLLPMILVMVILWIFLLGGGRKEKKRRAQMLASLGKGDRVQTVGGILGTIVEVRDEEIVVKVDENTNARLRFARSAIQTKLEDTKSVDVEPAKG